MIELFDYKVWNDDLGQYVAQPNRATLEYISKVRGIVIRSAIDVSSSSATSGQGTKRTVPPVSFHS